MGSGHRTGCAGATTPRTDGGSRRGRWRAAAAGGAVLALVLALSDSASAASTSTSASTSASTPASTSASFSQELAVVDADNQQGLAFLDGVHHVGFDLGGGTGRIVGYSADGAEVQRSGPLPTGHTNEISVRAADGNLYVTNSAASPPEVAVVDVRQTPPVVLRTISIPMASGAVAAVDNANDQLVVATGPTGGPYNLVFVSMTGSVLRTVPIPDEGITQGLEVVGDQILLLTSLSYPTRNRITVFSSTGAVLGVIAVPIANEAEGLSVDPATGTLYVGASQPNRVYRMSPAFTAPTGSTRVLTLTPVADATARQQAPTTAAGSAPTLLSDTQETPGSATRATAYLRFTVPALADGEQVVAASLGVQVTNATANGPTVWRTAPSWDERTLTWKSGQPARLGTAVGGFGSMAVGRRSTAISGVTGAGDVSLQLYADSTDGLQLSSRESTAAAARPALTVTVSTEGTAGG